MAEKELAPDWILQQALGVQSAAHNAFVREKGLGGKQEPATSSRAQQPPPQEEKTTVESPPLLQDTSPEDQGPYTLGIIDCKHTGATLIHSILDHLSENPVSDSQDPSALLTGALSKLSRTLKDLSVSQKADTSSQVPRRIPRSFQASVASKERHQQLLDEIPAVKRKESLRIHEQTHVKVADISDIIILSCAAECLPGILSSEDHHTESIYMTLALDKKIVISAIPNGPTLTELDVLINGKPNGRLQNPATIVRVEMNPATVIREGVTVIAKPTDSASQLSDEIVDLVMWMFERVGKVVWVPEAQMSAAAALCGAGPSFVTVMAEALANAGIGLGVEPKQAHEMVAQVLKGTASLLQQNGAHPAVLRESITASGGASHGVMVLEEAGLRRTVASAVKEAASDQEK